MSVRILEGWNDADWDAEVERQAEGTIFHTRLWARITTESFPELRDRSSWVEVTTDAGSSRHLLPLLEWRRGGGLVTTVHSSFPFIYGGPLPLRGAGGRIVLPEVLEHLETLRGAVQVTGNPLMSAVRPARRGRDPRSRADDARSRRRKADAARTGAVAAAARLEPTHRRDRGRWNRRERNRTNGRVRRRPAVGWGDELVARSAAWECAELLTHPPHLPGDSRAPSGTTASCPAPPERRASPHQEGVSVGESRSAEDVSAVYRLAQEASLPERWGGTPTFLHPERFYQNLVALGDRYVRFSVARFEDAVIGGVFALRFGRAVHYFAGYMDADAKAQRPNVLLQVDSILQAIRDGFAFYDFLPSGGSEPVEQFKEGFGGVRYPVPVFTRRSLTHRLLARARGR
ncbi:MAG: GNAT family N-acetyltransferase [Candidatus Eisenbacteria bacterium]